MTRRKFIKKLVTAGSFIVVGAGWLVKKAEAVPRRFICAVRFKKYPGPLKKLSDVHGQGKWSG